MGLSDWRGRRRATLLLFLAAYAFNGHPISAKGPFSGLSGRWVGWGSIELMSGEKERIRCRVTYFRSNAGADLKQNIRCASTSYKIEVKSDLTSSGGRVRGKWNETYYNLGGSVSGRATGDKINLRVQGDSFSATMSVVTVGSNQTVVIRPSGIELKTVSMQLRRG